MTAYHARVRRNFGDWLDVLLVDQSRTSEATLDDLREVVEAVQTSGAVGTLIAADVPAPARGYALLLPDGSTSSLVARLHVLEGQPDEVYRSLFSTLLVRAREFGGTEVQLDAASTAVHVRDRVEAFGADYAVTLGDASGTAPAEEGDGGINERPLTEVEEIVEATLATIEGLNHGEEVELEGAQSSAPAAEASAVAPDEHDEHDEERPAVEVVVVEDTTADEWECAFPGCGKAFTSKRGLTVHLKSHGA